MQDGPEGGTDKLMTGFCLIKWGIVYFQWRIYMELNRTHAQNMDLHKAVFFIYQPISLWKVICNQWKQLAIPFASRKHWKILYCINKQIFTDATPSGFKKSWKTSNLSKVVYSIHIARWWGGRSHDPAPTTFKLPLGTRGRKICWFGAFFLPFWGCEWVPFGHRWVI